MNKWQRFHTDYLSFTKKERIGIIALLLVVVTFYLLPFLLAKKQAVVSIETDSELIKAIDSLQARQTSENEGEESVASYAFEPSKTDFSAKAELFVFDPNNLSAEGWKKLGLKDKTIKTIINYRNKGGKFYQPDDLKKIWGLPASFYERVKNYIVIEERNKQNNAGFTAVEYKKPERKINLVDINTADTSAFIALPGIGSKLALRIVSFRNKLGGFYSANQVAETYGLPDSTFQKVKQYLVTDANGVRKLNINTASKEELKDHPYIKWNLANAIVEYRKQHGEFKTLEELKNIVLLDEAAFEKVKNYLSF
jgi:competence ComEA-like helix-hairpin-helix protein